MTDTELHFLLGLTEIKFLRKKTFPSLNISKLSLPVRVLFVCPLSKKVYSPDNIVTLLLIIDSSKERIDMRTNNHMSCSVFKNKFLITSAQNKVIQKGRNFKIVSLTPSTTQISKIIDNNRNGRKR